MVLPVIPGATSKSCENRDQQCSERNPECLAGELTVSARLAAFGFSALELFRHFPTHFGSIGVEEARFTAILCGDLADCLEPLAAWLRNSPDSPPTCQPGRFRNFLPSLQVFPIRRENLFVNRLVVAVRTNHIRPRVATAQHRCTPHKKMAVHTRPLVRRIEAHETRFPRHGSNSERGMQHVGCALSHHLLADKFGVASHSLRAPS